MIGRIQGTLISITAPKLLIDCNGVGYEVDVPMSTLYQLPLVGQQLTLLTHFHVREDQQQLFGFATNAERDAFRSLIKISGVGARTALAVLSGMSVNELVQAITIQEPGTLTRVPGIGKKTALRLVLHLLNKNGKEIDAAGMYALPGLIDMHTHIGGVEQGTPAEYVYKLWMAHGITTVRDVMTGNIRTISASQEK